MSIPLLGNMPYHRKSGQNQSHLSGQVPSWSLTPLEGLSLMPSVKPDFGVSGTVVGSPTHSYHLTDGGVLTLTTMLRRTLPTGTPAARVRATLLLTTHLLCTLPCPKTIFLTSLGMVAL